MSPQAIDCPESGPAVHPQWHMGYHHLLEHLRLYEYKKKKFKRGSWVVECSCSIMGGSTKQSYKKLPVFTVQMCEKLYNWLVAVNSFSQHWLSILTNKSGVSHTPSENGYILHEATVHIYFLQSTVIFKVKLFWSSRTRFFWGRFLSFTFAI